MNTKTDRIYCLETGTELDQTPPISIEWLNAFASHLENSGCSARTIDAYLRDLRAFASWFLLENGQPFTPDSLTGVDLRAYRAYALETGLAPKTYNRRRTTLARLINWAIPAGYLSYDPMQGVNRLQEETQAPRWLTSRETHQLLRQLELSVNAARTPASRLKTLRDQAIVALMLYAGLREEEVSLTDVTDLTITERKGKVLVRRGKGDKRREIPLSKEARRSLQLWLEASGRTEGPLIIGENGQRLGVRGIQHRIKSIRLAAGLDDHVTPHTLRHTFAKRLLDGGAKLTEVSRLLGHKRLDTTTRYVQPGWTDLEDAIEKF